MFLQQRLKLNWKKNESPQRKRRFIHELRDISHHVQLNN